MTPRDRRALIVGGAAIVGAVLLLRGVPMLFRGYGVLREGAVEGTALLERARATLSAAPLVRDSFAIAAGEIVVLAPKLVAGATAAEAAAALTAELSGAAQRAGLRVIGINNLPDSSTGTFRPVVLHVEAEGGVGGLAELMRSVEGGAPVLTVRSLHVLAADPLERQPGPELLRVDLVVVGWRLHKGAS